MNSGAECWKRTLRISIAYEHSLLKILGIFLLKSFVHCLRTPYDYHSRKKLPFLHNVIFWFRKQCCRVLFAQVTCNTSGYHAQNTWLSEHVKSDFPKSGSRDWYIWMAPVMKFSIRCQFRFSSITRESATEFVLIFFSFGQRVNQLNDLKQVHELFSTFITVYLVKNGRNLEPLSAHAQ